MADVTHIFGGKWSPPTEERIDPPEVQLLDAIINSGIDPDVSQVIIDGNIHRFNCSGRKGRTGWYVAFPDGVPAGKFGDWRTGDEQTWRADVGRDMTAAEHMANTRRMEEAKQVRDAERKKRQEVVSQTAEQIWSAAQPATSDHPYLKRKGVEPNGSRVSGDGRLIVPMFDENGELSSLQYIAHDGEKRFHTGGRTGGCAWQVGGSDDASTIYIAEGFATAATIHEVTGKPCLVSYSAANLPEATAIARGISESASIVIVADNDKGGIGQRHAEQACAKHGARYVMPPELGDANDYHQAGRDLLILLTPRNDEWLLQADEFSEQPAPIKWLVKHWIQQEALCMVHGPSGSGKSFLVLDWCMNIAAGVGDWNGNLAKQGSVVYLAGEGHAGLRGRIKGWKESREQDHLNMWVSRTGTDLNTPGGYQRVVDNVRRLPERPDLIVVDTVHRFMAGDENSAQDVKTMLDACAGLMDDFGCTVVLVHHTGVSDEAQHRARGSSAWRGALEIEISVQGPKGGKPGAIVQRKAKDSEMAMPMGFTLKQVELPGWVDEDGEQVTSAVMSYESAPDDVSDPIHKQKNILLQAWLSVHKPINDDAIPVLSRAALKRYLVEQEGRTEGTATKEIQPNSGRMVNRLLDANMIAKTADGYVVSDEQFADAMLSIPLR